jgi:hypothetical protein
MTTPNLFESPTLKQGEAYRFRIPISGCAEPIVRVNGQLWEPVTRWPSTIPKAWRTTTEGSGGQNQTYLVGTVRLEADQLLIGLSDGTIVNHYRPTTRPMALCA